jgi:hypothetical protein
MKEWMGDQAGPHRGFAKVAQRVHGDERVVYQRGEGKREVDGRGT